MQEIWKPVPGFDELYEVSNEGRIRSLPRTVKTWFGKRISRGRIRAFSKNSQGYLSIHMGKNGETHRAYVHRLVAIVFIPTNNNAPQVNHKDGNKSNNHVGNLEWCSASENCTHAVKQRLYETAKGERSGTAKLTEENVREIRRLAALGYMHKDIAINFPVGRKAITKIVNRQRWGHVD